MDGWWLVIVPLGAALLGGAFTAVLTRRTGKESNLTTAFDVAAKSLLATNEALRDDIKQLKVDVAALQSERTVIQTENQSLRTRVTHLENELEEVREANGTLADTVGKLVAAWPAGTPLPPLDPSWQNLRRGH